MIPSHVLLSIGGALAPDYFSPGTYTLRGEEQCSLWAVAYWRGESFRYERSKYGAPWIRVS